MFAGERPGAEGVRVGDGDLVRDHCAIREGDFHGSAEGFFCDVQGVVAAGPFGVFDGGDFVPEVHGVRAGGAFGGVGVNVVPGPVLQGDGEDVGDGVVQGFPGRGGGVLLGVVRARADDVVGVVAGLDEHRGHVGGVGGFGVFVVEFPGEVDPGLGLVFGGVFLGVGVQDGALGFTGKRQGYFVGGVGSVEHPGDDTVFAFIDRHR
ncbi:hypothetical protein PJL15_02713 [Paenarthrobacter nitroguajacolicus]|nr:hypothetical protein [Paenarthrobacter nitroguajacolicus]